MSTGDRSYSFDTSALIDGLERYYPESSFPGLWGQIDGLVTAGRLFISEEVWEEAHKRDEVAKAWCERHGKEALTVPTNGTVAVEVQRVLENNERLVMQMKGRNRADPFVIAVARIRGATVVTGEGSDGTERRPKIPYVCTQLGISCVRLIDVIRTEGWRFN
jgi:hypothetical protein